MTLATKITMLRIILIPVFIITLLQGHVRWAAVILTFTVVTDALDGFIARWKKQKSALGAFLDPVADKLLMFSSFMTFAYLKMIPLWIFVVILSRDLLIVIGWMITYFITGSKEVEPRVLGKITTIFQMFTIWIVVVGISPALSEKMLLLTVIMTTISGFDYLSAGSRRLSHHA